MEGKMGLAIAPKNSPTHVPLFIFEFLFFSEEHKLSMCRHDCKQAQRWPTEWSLRGFTDPTVYVEWMLRELLLCPDLGIKSSLGRQWQSREELSHTFEDEFGLLETFFHFSQPYSLLCNQSNKKRIWKKFLTLMIPSQGNLSARLGEIRKVNKGLD